MGDLNNNNGGFFFGLTRIVVVAFANDMVLLADSHSDLNDIFGKFSSNLKELELKMNVNKTKCLIFGNKLHLNDNITLDNKKNFCSLFI